MDTPNGPSDAWDERFRDDPILEARTRLGQALRRVRERAGLSTRQVPKAEPGKFYSSTQISQVESAKAVPSPELIDAYVAFGGDAPHLRALYQQAAAAANAAARRRRAGAAAETLPPRDAKQVVDRHEVQEHYVIVSAEAHYRFSPVGSIVEVDCVARLRAKAPGVRLAYGGFTYVVEQRTGVLSVEPVSGATVADLRESDTGAMGFYWELDQDLHPSDPEPHTVAYRVFVDSTIRSLPRLRFFADVGTERLTVSAEFPREVEPAALWWFAAVDPIDAEYRVHGRELTVDETGRYRRTFDDLVPYWTYGLAWRW